MTPPPTSSGATATYLASFAWSGSAVAASSEKTNQDELGDELMSL